MNDASKDADEMLMLRFGRGDSAAFERLYARHKGPLYRYFNRQCDGAHAEELFQDVWMRVIKAADSYTVDAKFTTWLYRIAHNRLVDHYRARARRPEESIENRAPEPNTADAGVVSEADRVADDPAQQPDVVAARHRQLERFAQALAALPQEQREAFVLREDGGLSLEEIAVTTGVGKETAKSRLRYAVSRLRKAMESWS